jgi:hypothetical protein
VKRAAFVGADRKTSAAGHLPSSLGARIEKSFRDRFAASERYPRQLHEMEQNDYMVMKRKEYSRQQTAIMAVAATPETS